MVSQTQGCNWAVFLENENLFKAFLLLSIFIQPRELWFQQPTGHLVWVYPVLNWKLWIFHWTWDYRSHSWLFGLCKCPQPKCDIYNIFVSLCNAIQCVLYFEFSFANLPFHWQKILVVLGFIFKLISYTIGLYYPPHSILVFECKICLLSFIILYCYGISYPIIIFPWSLTCIL